MLLNKNNRAHGNNEAYAQLKTRNRFRERLHMGWKSLLTFSPSFRRRRRERADQRSVVGVSKHRRVLAVMSLH